MRRLIGLFLTAALLGAPQPEAVQTESIYASQTVTVPGPRIQAEFPYIYEMQLVETGEMHVVYDGFLSSQAKGQTTVSYHRNPYLPDKLVLTGPAEDSTFNSRTYYLRIYAREEHWAIDRYLYGQLQWRGLETVTGDCLAVIYYVDEFISPSW